MICAKQFNAGLLPIKWSLLSGLTVKNLLSKLDLGVDEYLSHTEAEKWPTFTLIG